jgi:Predicted acetamidase/formamidase
MRVIPKGKVIYSFNRHTPAAYTVEDGETFWVETEDGYKGQIHSPEVLRPQIDHSIMGCSVGPIAVTGAEPGDTLQIEVLTIQLAPQGVMVTSPGVGVLGRKITEPHTLIVPVQDGFAHFGRGLKIPVTPMIGIIGVAPAEGDHHCLWPGDHGGNMDNKLITVGARVYLPVTLAGAGLALGDLHACMGDGELSGTGIEIAGRVCLRVKAIKESLGPRPLLETREGLYTIASAPDLRTAIEVATDDMVTLLMRKKSLGFPDAYRLMSAACDLQICQVVNKLPTVRVRAPKSGLQIASLLD